MKLTAIVTTVLLSASTASSQLVSSNPNFKREGANPYTCTTPKGKTTSCNQWLGMSKSGWKTQCVKPGTGMLSKLVDAEGKSLWLDAPETGCAALFDEAWADGRKWEAKNLSKEYRRNLREGHFNQHVEVKEAGTYELGACMVREVGEDTGFENGYTNTGGILTSLLQWHPVDTVSVHAVLPNNKTRWGSADNPLANVANIMPHWQFMEQWGELPETDTPGKEIGITELNDVYIYGSHGFLSSTHSAINGEKAGQILDGFEGHAGVATKYSDYSPVEGSTLPAAWTCYSETLHLDPGFYVIRTEIKPYMYDVSARTIDDPGPTWVSDYTGYGAVSNVHLTRQPGLAGQ